MEFTDQDVQTAPTRRTAVVRFFMSLSCAGLLSAIACRFAARFDPADLTEAQRRDAGIDPCEVERIKALRRPLIR